MHARTVATDHGDPRERSATSTSGHGGASFAHVTAALAQLQGQREADRRRLGQLERKLEAKLDESSGRERWAETQGSLNGLLEDVQALRLRVEGLDARLWARTGGSGAPGGDAGGLSGPRARELEQQVQAIEHQARLSGAALEELQRRQTGKFRRIEQAIEDSLRRLAGVEEQVRAGRGLQAGLCRESANTYEARMASLEACQERAEAALQAFNERFGDGMEATGSAAAVASAEEAVEAADRAERGLATLERRSGAQVQELSAALASLRVKVDGQLQRLGSLAERVETAHEPAVEALRAEFGQMRAQDQHRIEIEMNSTRNQLQESAENVDTAASDLRETLRQVQIEIGGRLSELEEQVHEVSLRAMTLDDQDCQRSGRGQPASGVASEPVAVSPHVMSQMGTANASGMCGHAGLSGRSGSEATSCSDARPMDPGDQAASPLHGAHPRMEDIAGWLRAADGLATRVASIERNSASGACGAGWLRVGEDVSTCRSTGEHSARDEASATAALSREVSVFQARLLASQLQLQVEDCSGDLDFHEAPLPVGLSGDEGEVLAELEERVCTAEDRLLGAEAEGPQMNESVIVASRLVAFGARLEPLEDAFRMLAQHLTALKCAGLEDGSTMASLDDLSDEKGSSVDHQPGARQPSETAGSQEVSRIWDEVRRTRRDLANLAGKVEEGLEGASAADDAIKADLQQLWREAFGDRGCAQPNKSSHAPAPSVDTAGSSSSFSATPSPLAPVRGKLDTLCEQVAELQSSYARTSPAGSAVPQCRGQPGSSPTSFRDFRRPGAAWDIDL